MKKKRSQAMLSIIAEMKRIKKMSPEEQEAYFKSTSDLWRKWEASDMASSYIVQKDDGRTPLNECFYCGFIDREEFWKCPMCNYYRRWLIENPVVESLGKLKDW